MANEICYVRLTTDDTETAESFYDDLFDGWSFGEPFQHGGRTFIPWAGGGGPGGDVVKKIEAEPLAWMPFVKVDSVDDTLTAAKNLDGKVKIDKTSFEGAYYAVIVDPTGALIGVWEDT
jgi:predicted enzyme related to lactoylglutathione lyase